MELELSCARGSNRGDRRRLRRLFSLWSGDAHCFVNYPEYILAPLLDQEINPAIRADAVKWTETSGKS